MKFGYFCNTTNWTHKPYHQLLDETKDITEYCDKNNWNSIWFTEHHFNLVTRWSQNARHSVPRSASKACASVRVRDHQPAVRFDLPRLPPLRSRVGLRRSPVGDATSYHQGPALGSRARQPASRSTKITLQLAVQIKLA